MLRQRIGVARETIGFFEAPFRNQRHIAAGIGVRRTSHHAGEVGVQPIPIDLSCLLNRFSMMLLSRRACIPTKSSSEESEGTADEVERPFPAFLTYSG